MIEISDVRGKPRSFLHCIFNNFSLLVFIIFGVPVFLVLAHALCGSMISP